MKLPMLMFAAEAVAEAPAAETAAPAPTAGDKFNKLMQAKQPSEAAPAKEPVKEPAKEPAPEPKKEPAAKEPEPKFEKKETKRPTSAVDALLSGKKPEAEPAATDDDPLKEFPLDAKEKNWAGLRKKAEDGWARAKELEAKVGTPDPKISQELESTRAALKEREAALAELKAKNDEYKDAMVAVNVELDPDFRREFIDGRKQLVEGAGKRFASYGGKPEELQEALRLPEGRQRDAAIEALLESVSDLSNTGRTKILGDIAGIDSLDERRAKMLANPQQSYAELERKHSAARQAQMEQAEAFKKETFERVLRELEKSVPTLGVADESLEDGKAWNEGRGASIEKGRALLSDDVTPEQVAAAAIKAGDYDRVLSLLLDTRKQLAERDTRLAEFESAAPDMKGRRGPAGAQPGAKKDPGTIFAETLRAGKSDEEF